MSAWEQWCDFCDRAKVAPDTLKTPEELAKRFNEETRGMATPEWVRSLMHTVQNERKEQRSGPSSQCSR